MQAKDRIAALLLIAMLVLPMGFIAVPTVKADNESLVTDKALYVVRWIGTGRTASPYVNVSITVTNMTVGHTYRLNVTRWASVYNGLENLVVDQYLREVASIPMATLIVNVTLGPRAADLTADDPTGVRHFAGTYNLTLEDMTLGTVVKTANFGIWGLTSNFYNFCDDIEAVGGGMVPGSLVGWTDNGTSILGAGFNAFPTNYTVGDYGLFDAVGRHYVSPTNATSGNWVLVNMTTFSPITTGVYDTTATFLLTHLLEVSVWTDMAEYQRTQTITIYAQVTKQSGLPNTGATIANATIFNSSSFLVIARWINNNNATVLTGSNWSMTATPGIYSATYKVRYNDDVGLDGSSNWTISVLATDSCGNNGTGIIWTIVKPAVLNKVIWIQPLLSLEKSDTAVVTFNVTYPDGSRVTLNLTGSVVLVLRPDGTNTSAVILATAWAGVYNATYYIEPTNPNGTYRFLIQKNALVDKVNVTWLGNATVPNKGPADDNYSDYFVVGPFQLLVEVITDKPAYAKGETALITATARYKDGKYLAGANVANWYGWPYKVVSGAQVWVDIYWPNGTWHMKINLIFTPPTPAAAPRWTGTYPTTADYPSGVYVVNCTADDKAGNVGFDSTTFLLAGLILQPTSGTVPPDWSPYLSYNATTGIVTAQVYYAGSRSLGTVITASASPTTLPANTTFILTIEAVDIPAVTQAWYSSATNLGVTNVATKGIQLAQVTTDTDGSFSTTIVFPSMPSGTYTILAIKAGTTTPWTKAKALASNDFTVIPGLLVAPWNGTSQFTTGNTLCNVVATGFGVDSVWTWPTIEMSSGPGTSVMRSRVNETITVLLINGTDALIPQVQSWAHWIGKSFNLGYGIGPNIGVIPIEWRFDGTATLLQALSAQTKVQPGFVLPVLQPAVYEITLLTAKVSTMQNGTAWTNGTTAVYTQEITTVSTSSDWVAVYGVTKDLIDLIAALDGKVVDLQGTVAMINTTLGQVNMTVNDINAMVIAVNDSVAEVKTMFGPIETQLSAIEAKIDSVNGNIVDLQTTLGSVETTLTDIGGKVTRIDGKVATIDTNLGTVMADVSALKGSVSTIQGSVATISTDVGTVKTNLASVASDLTSVKGTVSGLSTATYLAAGLAAVAAVAAIAAVYQITRKVYMPSK